MGHAGFRLPGDFCGLVAVEGAQRAWPAPLLLIGAGLAGYLLFLVTNFFCLEWLRHFLATGFPENSFPERLTTLIGLEAKAFPSAWFLASWVCFYRACTGAGPVVRF